jgi:CheY-like chemotaxis protein
MTDPQPTILLVDDEPAIRRIAVRVLQKAGFKVLEAGDGEEAFRVWQENQHDVALIVTDVMMPKRNGWELLEAVRAAAPDTPFVMTSGFDPSQGTPAPTGARVQMLGKPWEGPKLVAAVNSMLA